MNIQFITAWRKIFIAILTTKIISLFGFFSLYFPRPAITNLMASVPPRTSRPFDIFRAPFSMTKTATKYTVFVTFQYLILLPKYWPIAIFAFKFAFCSMFFHPTFIGAKTTRFSPGNMSINNKGFSALFTSLFDFWLMLHSINVLPKYSCVKYNSGAGRFSWMEVQ